MVVAHEGFTKTAQLTEGGSSPVFVEVSRYNLGF